MRLVVIVTALLMLFSVWIGTARMGPATHSRKRAATKEKESTKAKKTSKIAANDEVRDKVGDKKTEKTVCGRILMYTAWRLRDC